MIPAVLSAVAAATLFIALFTFWQSLRAAFGAGGAAEMFVALPADLQRQEVQERLDAVLRTLKDIELERDTGKIVEADYARLEARLRAQAKALLKERDAGLEPYLDEARTRVAGYLRSLGISATPDAAEAPPAASPASAATPAAATPRGGPDPASAAAPTCAACGLSNDADARFCKACGAKLSPAGAAEESVP